MLKVLRLLALSLFVAASVAYVGCEPAAETKTEKKVEDGGSSPEDKKEDKTSQNEQVPDGMVLVSLNVPAMH